MSKRFKHVLIVAAVWACPSAVAVITGYQDLTAVGWMMTSLVTLVVIMIEM